MAIQTNSAYKCISRGSDVGGYRFLALEYAVLVVVCSIRHTALCKDEKAGIGVQAFNRERDSRLGQKRLEGG